MQLSTNAKIESNKHVCASHTILASTALVARCVTCPSRLLPAQGEVQVEGLWLEKGRHEPLEQLLVEHAVDTATVHALAQQRTQGFPRDLPDA